MSTLEEAQALLTSLSTPNESARAATLARLRTTSPSLLFQILLPRLTAGDFNQLPITTSLLVHSVSNSQSQLVAANSKQLIANATACLNYILTLTQQPHLTSDVPGSSTRYARVAGRVQSSSLASTPTTTLSTLNSSSPKLQHSLLRLLAITISRLPLSTQSLSKGETATIVEAIKPWCFFRGGAAGATPAITRNSSSTRERDLSVSSSPSELLGTVGGGAMGSFALQSSPRAKTKRPSVQGKGKEREIEKNVEGSNALKEDMVTGGTRGLSSLSRSSSISSLRDGLSSESEVDEDEHGGSSPTRSRITSAHVRIRALSILSVLSASPSAQGHLPPHISTFVPTSAFNPRSLFHLIESDPVIQVRIEALKALSGLLKSSKGFLRIAEDRPIKTMSFTPLSTSLGFIVNTLHSRIGTLIQAHSLPHLANSQPNTSETHSRPLLLRNLLLVTEQLVSNAPYGRMREKPLAKELAEKLLNLLLGDLASPGGDGDDVFKSKTPKDEGEAAEVEQDEEKKREESIPNLASRVLTTLLSEVIVFPEGDRPQEFDTGTIANRVLEVLLERRSSEDVRNDGHSLEQDIHVDNLDECLWTLLAAAGRSAGTEWDGAPALELLLRTCDQSSTRIQLAQTTFLTALATRNGPALTTSLDKSFRKALDLAISSSSARIRAASVLCVSHLCLWPVLVRMLKDDPDKTVREAACRSIGLGLKNGSLKPDAELFVILGERSGEEGATWALANACDVLTTEIALQIDLVLLIDQVARLVQPSSGEKTQTNSIRALGMLGCYLPPQFDRAANKIFQSLANALESGPAKVQWNAATASSHTFRNRPLLNHAQSPTSNSAPALSALIDNLSLMLERSKNFKVRIQSLAAMSVLSMGDFGDRWPVVNARVMQARARLAQEEESVSDGGGRDEREHFKKFALKLEEWEAKFAFARESG
ncbi:hypothetical protein T439DRAFT_326945 [Meredithblackwellia eburnea MCA 4105]